MIDVGADERDYLFLPDSADSLEFALVVRDQRVCEAVEFGELVEVVPHGFVVRVKDMRTIFMDVDAFDSLGVYVAQILGCLLMTRTVLPAA